MMLELDYYEQDQKELPPELAENVYAPNQSEYTRTLQQVRAHLRTTALQLSPRHVQYIKAFKAQGSYKEVAERYRVNPQTVSNAVNSELGQELMGLMQYLNSLQEGASAMERQQLLWSIALNNQDIDPKTSISAIAEINRMTTDTDAAKAKIRENSDLSKEPTIVLQLMDSRLTPSPLDELPAHLAYMKDVN